MNAVDYIIIAVIGLILCGCVFAICKSKKSGKKCIGCPDNATCSGHCAGCSGCGCGKAE